jgi:mono/diheme cytochrome c family protein
MPPAGADDLFREVIAPHCMVCHSRRGTNLGSNQAAGTRQDIDFSSYERFISHAEQIERFIFHKGVMPLGGLNFDSFWDNSGPGRAELLASHLPDFDSFNSDGTVRRPGSPYPVIAAPRNTNVPVIVSAEGSSFATTYEWSIVSSPAGSNPSLSNADKARATFNTDMGGEYELQLIVGNDTGARSDAITALVTVSNLLPLPADLRYESSGNANFNIKTVLQTNPQGTNCTNCHVADGPLGFGGVPVYYTNSQVEGRDRYLEVLQRINFKEPVESPLLRKPSGNHHFGGLIGGFDFEGNRYNYDLFLNWILQGAPR